MEVLIALAGMTVGCLVTLVALPDRRWRQQHPHTSLLPPPVPQVDPMVLVADVLGKAIDQTASAIGRAVQAAQFAPVDPEAQSDRPAPQAVFDPDVQDGLVDSSDPTDGSLWLEQDREIVGAFNGTSSPIPGVELRP